MHTRPVLQKLFDGSLPQIHAARRRSLMLAVDAVVRGSRVAITQMGRALSTGTRLKHQIKRIDRLIGNRLLTTEHQAIYQMMTGQLLSDSTQPVILVDWSDFSSDKQQQLLRASVPVGGRSMTLYEELHSRDKLANRAIQHRFLDHIKELLPTHCTPVVIADAGFRVPFFRYVEQLGWDWLGRIRNRDYLCWEGSPYEWVSAKSLYGIATTRAQDLGDAQWVKSNPLTGRLVLVRQPSRGRKDRSLSGAPRANRRSRQQAKRSMEPWLLVGSPSLKHCSANKIVRMYKTRMQIEEGFRDTKSVAFGLGIANGRHTSQQRATNLLLIAALASFVLWLIGCMAKARRWDHVVRVNSSSRTPSYSVMFLARLVIAHVHERLPSLCLDDPGAQVADYLASQMATT